MIKLEFVEAGFKPYEDAGRSNAGSSHLLVSQVLIVRSPVDHG